MATLADIAKKCGTSTATVSYVLNGQGGKKRISLTMQERIRAAAEELGYVRASSSSEIKRVHIGLYWPQNDLEMLMPSLINGVNAALVTESIPVTTSIHPYERGHLETQEYLWKADFFDSAMVFSANAADLQVLASKRTSIPTVLVSRVLKGYSSVSIDHQEAGMLAANHAIQKGGNDIALVLNPSSMLGLNLRGKAILETCKKQGIDLQDQVFFCENLIDDGYELGLRMIREKRIHKVIICVYDMVAFGIMSAFNEAGFAVGSDVEILSTSASLSRLFARSTPPMTVVDLKMEEVAQRATRLVIDLATQRITAPQQVFIHPVMLYRQSSPMAITL